MNGNRYGELLDLKAVLNLVVFQWGLVDIGIGNERIVLALEEGHVCRVSYTVRLIGF
jgi:hypothetical protein